MPISRLAKQPISTFSLSYACEFGNGTGEGLVVNYASKSLRNIFPLSNQYRERYFVAAATSKMNEDSLKIFSGWKVYTDNGLPVSITTSSLETCENLFYRARRVNESNKNQVVFDVTFSLPVSRASNCKFILKKGGTKIIDLPDLSSVPNAKTDLLDAIRDTAGIKSNLFFMKTEKGINQYRFYGFIDNSSSDPIKAILIDTAGLVLDTLKNHVGVSSDNGYMNIVSTIFALTSMSSSTTDPLNPGTIPSLSDSVRIKLLIAAVLDQSLAHNSPRADENEKSQGIFTNYMQFMDNMVGNWDSLAGASAGIKRLERINDIILKANRNNIVDPVYIKNHGTLMEYGRPKLERKNYAFYDGYTRLYFEMGKMNYNGIKSGTGVMFSVSNNIELYAAEHKDSINMFNSPIIGNGFHRIIYPSNSDILDKLNREGFWIKGVNNHDNKEQDYYTDVKAVRLPVKKGTDTIAVQKNFSLPQEKQSINSIIGTVISGNEKNIIKLFTISCKNSNDNILGGDRNPDLLLHGNKRLLEIDSAVFNGMSIEILTQGTQEQRENITVKRENNYKAIIIDSAQGEYVIQTRFKKNGITGELPGISSGDIANDATCVIINVNIRARKLFSQEAVDEVLNLEGVIGEYPVEINLISEDELFQIDNPLDNKFELEVTDGLQLMEKASEKLVKILPTNKNDNKIVLDRDDYIKILNKKTLFLVPSAIEEKNILTVRIKKNASSKEDYKHEEIILNSIFGQIFAEQITDQILPGHQGSVYNPSVIKTGGTATFKIDILPSDIDFETDKIRWFAETIEGKAVVSFPEGNSGTTVKVRSDYGTGVVRLIVKLPGLKRPDPEFLVDIAKEEEVKVTFYVGYDGTEKLLNSTQINEILKILNETYEQVAIKFNLSNEIKAGIDDSLKRTYYQKVDTKEKFRKLVELDKETGGLEIYFVRELESNDNGGSNGNGIGVATSGRSILSIATTVAHEIGHACKLDDIYIESSDDPPYNVCNLEISEQNLPLDCNKFFNYYNDQNYCDILSKLLMNGIEEDNLRNDIPLGRVYGIDVNNKDTMINIGFRDMKRNPKHP